MAASETPTVDRLPTPSTRAAATGAGRGHAPARVLPAFWFGGAFVYLAILTNGGFDLNGVESFGQAYSAYARSILEGRFDVTRAVIGNEGFYVDGKVFLYSGILPALLRIPFLLADSFVPGPRVFVFGEAVLTAVFLHLTVLHVLTAAAGRARTAAIPAVVFSGIFAWFASPALLLTSNASIYHEPVGAGLVLFAAMLFLLRRQIGEALAGRLPTVSAGRLALVALTAALSLQARPPLALSLFFVTGLLCLWAAFDASPGGVRYAGPGRWLAKILVPALLLAASITVFLALNWVKFGDPLKSGPLDAYGFYLFVEGDSPRFQAFSDYGRFNLLRVVPNFFGYAFSHPQLHESLLALFDAGNVRFERPASGILTFWIFPVIYAGLGAAALVRMAARHPLPCLWLCGMGAAMAVTALAILSYATVTLRYAFELWPILFFLALAGMHAKAAAEPSAAGLWGLSGLQSFKMPALLVWLTLAVSAGSCLYANVQLKNVPVFNGDTTDLYKDLRPLEPKAGAARLR